MKTFTAISIEYALNDKTSPINETTEFLLKSEVLKIIDDEIKVAENSNYSDDPDIDAEKMGVALGVLHLLKSKLSSEPEKDKTVDKNSCVDGASDLQTELISLESKPQTSESSPNSKKRS